MCCFVDGDEAAGLTEDWIGVVGAIDLFLAFCDETEVQIVDLCSSLLEDGVEHHPERFIPRQVPLLSTKAVVVFVQPLFASATGEEEDVAPKVGVALFFASPSNVELGAAVALADDVQDFADVVGNELFDGVIALDNAHR